MEKKIALPFVIAGFILGMVFGMDWWQAAIVIILSASTITIRVD